MARLDWYIRANLKPRHFQLLVALDETRHVGRVAQYMNVTQPAISKAITELERGLEVKLFERDPKGLIPTPYGECLIRLSRSMLRELDMTRNELKHLLAGTAGSVRIGMLPAAAPVLVPRAVIAFKRTAADAVVALHEGNSESLMSLMRENKLDLIVGTLPPTVRQGMQYHSLHQGEAIVAVCGADHPLLEQASISPADLAGYPMVIPPAGSYFREHFEAVMDKLDVEITADAIESGSMAASNTLICEMGAVSFYSRHLAEHYFHVAGINTLALEIPVLTAPIGIAWATNPGLPVAAQQFVSQLEDVAANIFENHEPAS
ncbi:LysR family transcriptional regulator [Pusillimonas sp.]|uniref:LysR family transcriptional regulator n=1 Tax=Pusillimonas sp. TaxID=3040095 RepID=UPI0037C86AB0